MKIDQVVLDAHAQFGGDLDTMQKTYEHADLVTEITRLRQNLSEAEQRAARAEAEKTGLLQSLQHHTGCDHGVMAIRMLVDRAEEAERREKVAKKSIASLSEVLQSFARLEPNYSNCRPSDAVFAKGCVYVSDIRAAERVLQSEGKP